MVDELTLYDEETEELLSQGVALNQVYDDLQISEAIAMAMAQHVEQEQQAPSGVVLDLEASQERAQEVPGAARKEERP
jgi:hypothetical protein